MQFKGWKGPHTQHDPTLPRPCYVGVLMAVEDVTKRRRRRDIDCSVEAQDRGYPLGVEVTVTRVKSIPRSAPYVRVTPEDVPWSYYAFGALSVRHRVRPMSRSEMHLCWFGISARVPAIYRVDVKK